MDKENELTLIKKELAALKAENSSIKEELQQLKMNHQELQDELEGAEAGLRVKEGEGKQFVESMIELFNSGLAQATKYRRDGFYS